MGREATSFRNRTWEKLCPAPASSIGSIIPLDLWLIQSPWPSHPHLFEFHYQCYFCSLCLYCCLNHHVCKFEASLLFLNQLCFWSFLNSPITRINHIIHNNNQLCFPQNQERFFPAAAMSREWWSPPTSRRESSMKPRLSTGIGDRNTPSSTSYDLTHVVAIWMLHQGFQCSPDQFVRHFSLWKPLDVRIRGFEKCGMMIPKDSHGFWANKTR